MKTHWNALYFTTLIIFFIAQQIAPAEAMNTYYEKTEEIDRNTKHYLGVR